MQLTTTFRTVATLPHTELTAAPPIPAGRMQARRWSPQRWSTVLTALSFATLLIHGYHPLAEDGGLYVAGVEWKLKPSLFPRFTEFVSEHLRFSAFAPLVATLTRFTHLPLLTVLLVLNLVSIALTLAAARALLRRVTENDHAQLAGVGMLAAMWTVPIAGTSLLLMDPYVTARSLSTPLSLWAVALALDDWKQKPRALLGCLIAITLAAAFHPLMAGYALGLILVLRGLRSQRKALVLGTLAVLTISAAAILQARAPAESAAVVLAAKSRYYWFLSQWHWYELFGLAGPLLVLAVLMWWNRPGLRERGSDLALACILYGCFAAGLTLVFGQESYHAHIIARLQPLRGFLIIYAVMFLLLGASVQQHLEQMAARSPALRPIRLVVPALLLVAAGAMFLSQRREFPASAHIELPWRMGESPNPWVRAFLWCRDNTPRGALFALDAHYITTPGEDAQTFRAIALRSAVPDFSKDGGEAAITPRLAGEWLAGFTAQLNLDRQTAPQLRAGLAPFGVDWLILRSSSPAVLECPYNDGALKVCRLQP
jgi:hypothetical protein